MTRLIHLTDLHFGAERTELILPLAAAIRSVQPDVLVVTGDLSHRARPHQLRAAMAFLQQFQVPLVVMPGNHDIPLYNLVMRWTAPFHNWRRAVGQHAARVFRFDTFRVLAANTADPWQWRGGHLRKEDVSVLGAPSPTSVSDPVSILACHHPLAEPPGFDRGETRGARQALPALIDAGVQIVLSGHLHHWSIGLGICAEQPQPLLMVQTGTALCGRKGEKDHGFSVLKITKDCVEVTAHTLDEGRLRFAPRPTQRFARREGLWHPSPSCP